MPKFYIFSDCHGYYNELKKALDEAGFDPNNEDHWLIGAGDYVDRGRQPQEVIDFLMGLDRCLLVRGNHTDLLMDCLERGFPYKHDWSNGTAQTILDLAPNAKTFQEACTVVYEKVKPFVNRMVNYVELRNYIITHSFVPLKNLDGLPGYYIRNRKFEVNPSWRYAHAGDWYDARWGNPFQLAEQGFLPEKTLIFGHWSTYDQRPKNYEGDDLFDPIYGDGYIGIDATTALSGKVNVLVIEDEFLENNT